MDSRVSKDWDKEEMRGVLMNTVMLLCKNGITFKRNIRVQGLLGITIDDDDIFLVQINENVENESSIALSDTVVVNPVKHASCTTSFTNNSFIDKTLILEQVDDKQMIGSATKVNVSSSSGEEEYSCVEYMQSYEEERQHHGLYHCTSMDELKQEKDEVLSDFETLNVYNTSDADVSGECNNQVNIKCEMEEDFCYSTDQLTHDNSLQQNIKQEPQSDNIVCLPYLSSSTSQGSFWLSNNQDSTSSTRVYDTRHRCTETTKHPRTERVKEFTGAERGHKFSVKSSVKQHLKSVHYGERRYKCTVCKKTFTQQQSLKSHVSAVHEGLKPHTCTECGKNFARKPDLQNHMNAVHTKEKCYSCAQCDKIFYWRTHLTKHVKTLH